MKSLLLLAALATAPAAARDARIATRLYDPAQIVTIHAHAGIQSTVEFGEDERIENVAVGDSADWQVTPNKRASLLFVKPLQLTSHTNMTVVTSERTYLFDLVSGPRAVPLYVMRFTYPPRPVAPKPVVLAAAAAEPAAAPKPAPTPAPVVAPAEPDPADLHFDWAMAGAAKLLPARTFDDGKSTWLAWPKDVSMPAILSRGPNGEEGPVNYTVRGDYVVVDGVPPQLVLRQGKLMATLTPAPHAPTAGAAPSAQTASIKG